MNKSEEIFDFVISTEDQLLTNVRSEVKQKALEKYGNEGASIAEKYYRQIDGEEEIEDEEICDDCKEKAQKLIKVGEDLRYFSDVLTSDSVSKCLQQFDCNVFYSLYLEDKLNQIIDTIKENSCFDVGNIEDAIKTKILLEIARRFNEHKNTK